MVEIDRLGIHTHLRQQRGALGASHQAVYSLAVTPRVHRDFSSNIAATDD
jgi:hypothetical protein